jgi:hypothetical protein
MNVLRRKKGRGINRQAFRILGGFCLEEQEKRSAGPCTEPAALCGLLRIPVVALFAAIEIAAGIRYVRLRSE